MYYHLGRPIHIFLWFHFNIPQKIIHQFKNQNQSINIKSDENYWVYWNIDLRSDIAKNRNRTVKKFNLRIHKMKISIYKKKYDLSYSQTYYIKFQSTINRLFDIPEKQGRKCLSTDFLIVTIITIIGVFTMF